MRSQTGDVKKTGNRRHERVDRRRETGGVRQSLDVRQETEVVRQEMLDRNRRSEKGDKKH